MSTIARSISEPAPDVEVINRQRMRKIDREGVAGLARRVLDRIGRADATVTITFIRDSRMRQLNRDFRGIDRPTDVLSFGYNEDDDDRTVIAEPGHLGDVVISVDSAERYGAELGLSFNREIDMLVIHGVLHLAGFDHETDNGEMNRLEKRLRKEFPEGSSFSPGKPWNLK